jgi:CubicO group peptidase (beta-lactamase class C family)
MAMMSSLRYFGSVVMLLGVLAQPATAAQQSAPLQAVKPKPALSFDPSEFSAYTERARQDWKVPGMAVAVVRGNEILLIEGYGLRRIDTPAKVDNRTVFNIGSVTKSFTAAMIASLVADKKLALNDKVTKHLPGVLTGESANDITIADLLSHRSGLAPVNYSVLGDVSRQDMLQRLQYLPRAASFRSNFVYNNFGYVASAAVAEKVTGSSWDQLIRDRLFQPIGLADAVTSAAEQLKAANRASPHGKIAERPTVVTPVPLRMVGPAGTIGMSIEDLARWVQLHLNEGRVAERQVLAPEMVRAMQAPHISQSVTPGLQAIWPSTHFRAYGLGWFMRDYRGVKLLEHGGNTTGFTAHVAFVPELDFGVAILSNMDSSPLPSALLYRAVDMALGGELRDWSAEFQAANEPPAKKPEPVAAPARPALPLDLYVGSYRSPLYGEARVSRKGDKLILQLTDQLTGELTATGVNSFSAKWRDPYLAAVGSGGPFVFESVGTEPPKTLLFDLPGEKIVYTRVAGAS